MLPLHPLLQRALFRNRCQQLCYAVDLLFILWPVFFIAASRQDPHLKVRNFRKSIARGATRARGVSATTSISHPLRPRMKIAGGSGNYVSSIEEEQRPAWDIADPRALAPVSKFSKGANLAQAVVWPSPCRNRCLQMTHVLLYVHNTVNLQQCNMTQLTQDLEFSRRRLPSRRASHCRML